jgi:hypothetical protein
MSRSEKLRIFLQTHLHSISWDYDGYVRAFPPSIYDPQKDWNQTIITKINQISATIFKDTLKGGANCIIISDYMVELFSTLEFMRIDRIMYGDDYYKLGELAGRYHVFVVHSLSINGEKIYVCKLDNNTDPISKCVFNLEKYIRVGTIKIDRQIKLDD